jgi:hypothetical protein
MNQAVSKKLTPSLTRSDLIKALSKNQRDLASKDVELAVKSLINLMSDSLSKSGALAVLTCNTTNLEAEGIHEPVSRLEFRASTFRISRLPRNCGKGFFSACLATTIKQHTSGQCAGPALRPQNYWETGTDLFSDLAN